MPTEDKTPLFPIWSKLDLEVYRMQLTGLIAFKLGVFDLEPTPEEDLRMAIRGKDAETLRLLDALVDTYSRFCEAAREDKPEQWELQSVTDVARSHLAERLKPVISSH
jgi:hypothetical protein